MKKEEIEQATNVAVKLSEHLDAKEQAMFVAGFQTCIKWLSENERLKAEMDYYQKRCELAEDCLEKSPCDPDITIEQIEAWNKYHAFIKEFGIQPPKQ